MDEQLGRNCRVRKFLRNEAFDGFLFFLEQLYAPISDATVLLVHLHKFLHLLNSHTIVPLRQYVCFGAGVPFQQKVYDLFLLLVCFKGERKLGVVDLSGVLSGH